MKKFILINILMFSVFIIFGLANNSLAADTSVTISLTRTIKDGDYVISNTKNSKLVLSIHDSSKEERSKS